MWTERTVFELVDASRNQWALKGQYIDTIPITLGLELK
jgi:hypothetical protein